MLPQPPKVVICASCKLVYWLNDAVRLGSITTLGPDWGGIAGDFDSDTAPTEWLEAESVQEPSELEFYHAIETGLAGNADEERILHILAWWKRNEMYRKVTVKRLLDSSDMWRYNCEAILNHLVDRNTEDNMLKVELLRELERYDEAITLIDEVSDKKYPEIKELQRLLCRRGNPIVQIIESMSDHSYNGEVIDICS